MAQKDPKGVLQQLPPELVQLEKPVTMDVVMVVVEVAIKQAQERAEQEG